MAVDIEAIGVAFDTSGLVRGQRALKDTEQAANKTADAADKAGQQGSRGFKAYGDAAAMAERQTRMLADTSATASRLMGAALAGLGVRELISLTDQYTKFTAQLRLATNGAGEYASAYSEVQRISKTAQGDLSSTGTLFARIANATRELGVSQQRVADITEVTSLSLKVSGATAAESASAMLQLSQAFGSGVLRGEEFNAVNEAAPRLMRALADGIGVPVGALRKMASEGLLTSAVMAEALPKALEDLRKEAVQVQTISGSFTLLKNSVMEFVGTQAQASGAVSAVTSGIALLANNIDTLAAVALGFGTAKFAETMLRVGVETQKTVTNTLAYVAAQQAQRESSIVAAQAEAARTEAMLAQATATKVAITVSREEAIAKLALARADIASAESAMAAASAAGAQTLAMRVLKEATNDLAAAETRRSALVAELALLGQQQARVSSQITAATAAQAAAQTALGTATGASLGILSRAVGLLGGPIGAITTLLGLGVTAWTLWGSSANESEKKASTAVAESTQDIIARLDAQIKKLQERNALAASGLPELAKSTSPDAARMVDIRAQMERAQSGTGEFAGLDEEARLDIVRKLGAQYGELYSRIQAVNEEQMKLDAVAPAAALLEIRERLLGVNKQYIADLVTLQNALKKGAVTEKEYIQLVSELATQTYNKSQTGKDAAKGKQGDKAQIMQDLKDSQTEIALEKNIYSDRNKFLQQYFAAGLISEEEYYQGRRTAQQEYLDAAKGYYGEEISALQTYIASTKPKSAERINAETRLNDVLAKQNELMREMAGATATDEIDRISKRTVAVRAYDFALKEQLRTQREANNLAVAGVGQGDRQRNLNASIFEARRQFDKQQRELAMQLTGPNAISKQEYDEKLALLKRYEQDSVQAVIDGNAKIRVAQDDWTKGATRAFENYRDSAENVASQTEKLFTDAFTNMEDGIVRFMMTGKASFRSLAESIIADLVRIQTRQAMTGMFGGSGGGFMGFLGLGGGYQGAAGADGAGSVADFMSMDAAASFDGGGFTGSGSRSGGMDGKGGFPAILHPNETVVDHTRGQSAGKQITIHFAPTYHIDSRVDQVEMMRNLERMQRATIAEMEDRLERQS